MGRRFDGESEPFLGQYAELPRLRGWGASSEVGEPEPFSGQYAELPRLRGQGAFSAGVELAPVPRRVEPGEPLGTKSTSVVRLETRAQTLKSDLGSSGSSRLVVLEDLDHPSLSQAQQPFDFGFDMPLGASGLRFARPRRRALEQLFPFWHDGLRRLPRQCPPLLRAILQGVQRMYQETVTDSELAHQVRWMLIIIVFCTVEPRAQLRFEDVWAHVLQHEDAAAAALLASDHIEVYRHGMESLRVNVRFPEAACRLAAAAHHYPLQVDPAVSPFGVEQQDGGVALGEFDPVDSKTGSDLDALIEKHNRNKVSTRVKRGLRSVFWWLEINKDANDFVPPTYGYTAGFEDRNWSANERLNRFFTRYTFQGERIRCDGPLPPALDAKLTLFRQVDRIRLLYLSLNEVVDLETCRRYGVVHAWFPLHQQSHLARLKRAWADIAHTFVFSQPITAVRDYFGDETGALFTFQMVYADALKLPAVLGMLLWLAERPLARSETGRRALTALTSCFCVFMMTWATHFTQKWYRYESRQRASWGLSVVEDAGHKDPLDPLDTVHSVRASPDARDERIEAYRATGDLTRCAKIPRALSAHSQFLRRALTSAALMLVCTAAVLLFCSAVLDDLADELGVKISGIAFPDTGFSNILRNRAWRQQAIQQFKRLQTKMQAKAITLALSIKVFDEIWRHCVTPLTNFEGHGRWHQYRNSAAIKYLVVKLVLFFSPLMYITTVKNARKACEGGSCVGELRTLLITLLGAEVLWRTVYRVSRFVSLGLCGARGSGSPRPRRGAGTTTKDGKNGRDGSGGSAGTDLPPGLAAAPSGGARDDADLMLLDGRGTAVVAELQPLAASVGLVSVFSATVAWLPALALLVNLVEIRISAVQLCFNVRRPFPSRGSLGSAWKYTLRALSFMSVVSNAYLLAFDSVGADWSRTAKMVLAVGVILVGTGVKEIIHVVYPDAGHKVMLDSALFGPRGTEEEIVDVRDCLKGLGFAVKPGP